MIAYGMQSAALTTADLHRLEAFHSQSLRKIQRIKATFYTKVLTAAQTIRNEGVQPPPHTPHSQGTAKG